jgi:uncharacterized protein with GYD domain
LSQRLPALEHRGIALSPHCAGFAVAHSHLRLPSWMPPSGLSTKEKLMAKYLIEASYTAEGLKGLQKDKASGRKQAVTKLLEGLEGKLEAMYFAMGEHDVILIVDVPDVVTGAALSLGVSATGLVRTKSTALLTVEETDRALAKKVNYRAPGE